MDDTRRPQSQTNDENAVPQPSETVKANSPPFSLSNIPMRHRHKVRVTRGRSKRAKSSRQKSPGAPKNVNALDANSSQDAPAGLPWAAFTFEAPLSQGQTSSSSSMKDATAELGELISSRQSSMKVDTTLVTGPEPTVVTSSARDTQEQAEERQPPATSHPSLESLPIDRRADAIDDVLEAEQGSPKLVISGGRRPAKKLKIGAASSPGAATSDAADTHTRARVTKTSASSQTLERGRAVEQTLLPIPGVRRSKVQALSKIAECLGSDRDSSPSPPPYSRTVSRKRQHADVDTDDEDGDAYGEADDEGESGAESDASFIQGSSRSTSKKKALLKKRPAISKLLSASRRKAAKSSTKSKTKHRGVHTYHDGVAQRPYARGWSDYKRFMVGEVSGPLWCLYCTQPEGVRIGSRWSRIKDSPGRHLKKCSHFAASRYHQNLIQKARTTHEGPKTHKGRTVRKGQKTRKGRKTQEDAPTLITHEDVVWQAIHQDKKVGAAVYCPNGDEYTERLKSAGLDHYDDVLGMLEPRATLYMMDHCKCCPYPHISEFRPEK
ncbi:hypothetical protein BD413DRAFT_587005 [Trametes elegans]|nr:hypothetical protein BD413DRAFT_587005 [Trametes elegans]